MRRLVCCRRRTKDFSVDFEESQRIVSYNGLESRILDSCSYENANRISIEADGCAATESMGEDASSCSSSSKDAFGSSFSSQYMASSKQEDELPQLDEWETLNSLGQLCAKGKAPIVYTMEASDIESMKEKFARLLLGDDVSGGARGMSTALALSNAITNLSASVFGELWKLEPLSDNKKGRWRKEMDWLLYPTNYMIELVPAKQSGANGRTLEIMTPKARCDVHTILPALQKLDAMLLEVLDSMVETEFYYDEMGSRAEGRSRDGPRLSMKWWLPSPRVPDAGLSTAQRKRLGFQARLVHQVLKAAKSINEQILLQMQIPPAVKVALPKTGKTSLGEVMYHALTAESITVEEIMLSLDLKTEHSVLETVNRLEGAVFAWKQKLMEESEKRSPIRYPWYFVRDIGGDIERIEFALEKAEVLLRLLKYRFPNLPQTFIDVTKVQYNKDIGHSIVEAYSRVIVNLAFSILSRIGDILQEDDLKKPSTPIANLKFDFSSEVYLAGITETPPGHIRRSLIEQMNMVDGRHCNFIAATKKELKHCTEEAKKLGAPGLVSPLRSRGIMLWKRRS